MFPDQETMFCTTLFFMFRIAKCCKTLRLCYTQIWYSNFCNDRFIYKIGIQWISSYLMFLIGCTKAFIEWYRIYVDYVSLHDADVSKKDNWNHIYLFPLLLAYKNYNINPYNSESLAHQKWDIWFLTWAVIFKACLVTANCTNEVGIRSDCRSRHFLV